MTVQQVCATHCTFGSSALEHHNEELAEVVFGYSARAGSLDPATLRRAYQRLEPCLHYDLPADTPQAERLRLTADSAPRRLFFLPAMAGLQVVGQICYRATDWEGRPGSYFAHLAFHDEPATGPRWTAVDVLKLWNAPGWLAQDRADLPHRLPALSGLGELLAGRRPTIDDQVLWSFLTTPTGNTFDDPGEVIPARWRSADPLQRQAALIDLLEAALEVIRGRRRSVVMVAEPSVSALLFYGVGRLLPPGSLRAAISFSTFEGDLQRCRAMLSATWFHARLRSDLPAEAYRGPIAVLNTLNGRRSEPLGSPGIYAQRMVIRLVEHGWAALDRTLAGFKAAGAATPDDLEQLAQLQRTAVDLLTPHQPPPDPSWRENPTIVRFLQQAVASELAGMGPPASALRPIVGSPAHRVLLELLAGEAPTPITRPALEFLLHEYPVERVADLVNLTAIDPAHRADALARALAAQRTWPPGIESVWEEAQQKSATPAETLLALALTRLDPAVQAALGACTPPERGPAFLAALWVASRRDARGWETVVAQVPEAVLVRLFQCVGPDLFSQGPPKDAALAARLAAMARTLHDHPDEFPERLDFLLAGSSLLADAGEKARLDAWNAFRQAVLRIGELQGQLGRGLRHVPLADLDAAGRSLAQAVATAIPPGILPDNSDAVEKLERTRRLARELLGGMSLLPPGVWQYEALWEKISRFFRTGVWPATSLRRMVPGYRRRLAKRWVLGAAVVLGVVGLVGILKGFKPDGSAPPASPPAPVARGPVGAAPQPSVKPNEDTPPAQPATAGKPQEPAEPTNDPIPPEQPLPPADPEPSLPPVPVAAPQPETVPANDEAGWVRQAQQFAAEHAGLVIDTHFSGGRQRIALDMLEGKVTDPTPWLLAAVWLELDGESYVLGNLETPAEPSRTVSSPSLAAHAGLTQAGIAMESDADSFTFSVEGKAPEIVEQVDQMTRIRTRRAEIESLLQKCLDTKAPDADRARARDALAQLVELELPESLPKPQADDPRYATDSDAYLAALAAYNDAQHARTLRERELAPRARMELDRLDELMQQAPNASALSQALPPEVPSELAALRARCRRAVLVIYAPPPKTPAPPAPAGKPAEDSPAEAAKAEPPQPQVPAVVLEGSFTLQTGRQRRPSTLVFAQVKPLVYLPTGRILPEAIARERRLRIACRIEERKSDGTTRTIRVDDIHVQGSQSVFSGAVSLVCQFEFYQRELLGAAETRVAESPPFTVERLEADTLYTPKFQLSPAGLATLDRLTNGL